MSQNGGDAPSRRPEVPDSWDEAAAILFGDSNRGIDGFGASSGASQLPDPARLRNRMAAQRFRETRNHRMCCLENANGALRSDAYRLLGEVATSQKQIEILQSELEYFTMLIRNLATH
jgi:hypothetical protein